MAGSETMMFKMDKDKENEAQDILFTVYKALNEKVIILSTNSLAIFFREILHISPII